MQRGVSGVDDRRTGALRLEPHGPAKRDRPSAHRVGHHALATSISSGGTGGAHYPGETGTLANNPNVALLNNQRGYQLFTVTPDAWRAEVKVMDQVDRPGGQISTIARFVVDPKQPGPQSG
jgi:alkaline phosphatase D